MQEIASSQNKLFKRYKSLLQKKYREEEQLFLLEGKRYVDTAIQSGSKVDSVIFSKVTWEIEKNKEYYLTMSNVVILSDELFKELVQTEQSQGIIGVISFESHLCDLSEADFKTGKDILLLDRLQDPGNLGTIIRTADATGIEHIILMKGTVDPFNPKVLRSTAGSILNVKFIFVESVIETIEVLHSKGFNVIATALEEALDYDTETIYHQQNCLIIGNEANGISEILLDACDVRVKLPIIGLAESLNASVAAGVMMYKLLSVKRKRIF